MDLVLFGLRAKQISEDIKNLGQNAAHAYWREHVRIMVEDHPQLSPMVRDLDDATLTAFGF